MTPLKLLKTELETLLTKKEEFIKSFLEDKTPFEDHCEHMDHLVPLIRKYRKAIKKLKN